MTNIYRTLFRFLGYVALIVIIASMRICINRQKDEILHLKEKIIDLESYQKADSIINLMEQRRNIEYRILNDMQ